MTMAGDESPPTPGGKPPPTRKRLIGEISAFFIFMGALLGIFGYFIYNDIAPEAPPIHGHPRNLAIGVPMLAMAGLHLLCGIAFLASRKTFVAVLGAVAVAIVALTLLVFVGINITTLLIAAAPVIVAQRLSLLSKTKPDGEKGDP